MPGMQSGQALPCRAHRIGCIVHPQRQFARRYARCDLDQSWPQCPSVGPALRGSSTALRLACFSVHACQNTAWAALTSGRARCGPHAATPAARCAQPRCPARHMRLIRQPRSSSAQNRQAVPLLAVEQPHTSLSAKTGVQLCAWPRPLMRRPALAARSTADASSAAVLGSATFARLTGTVVWAQFCRAQAPTGSAAGHCMAQDDAAVCMQVVPR